MGIPERKEREKEARREEILNAAQKVFFEKGLAATTVDDIAQVAELSKGTLYLYYHSKEDLYLATAGRGMDIMYGMFERAVAASEDPITQIFNIGDAYYQFFQQQRDFFRMFYYFESPLFHAQISKEMMEQCTVRDCKVWDLVASPVRRAIEAGLLKADLDPLEVGIMLWSNANGFFRLLDRNEQYWREKMGVDLLGTLRKSSSLLLEAMLTEEGRRMHANLQPYREFVVNKENQQ